MKPHLSLIWRTLKPELFSAAAAAGSSDEQQAAQQVCTLWMAADGAIMLQHPYR